ncbi:FISUMP domain-containing protein [Dysgonomonas sp. 25]|uniref:FISUMP domain-containing protein n=1 Tax=Dysgonomonas sp. 25 TaxID=2302933 RepID=UPI0013D33E87|nr:FISUMP domain-containing protein [Dysgonomonas sp. 25]NDV68696.1 hypothetical protein [Dysgonomonas sp. 25]
MKRTILTQAIIILAFLTTTISMHGQVTIGSGEAPNKGALLDLKMDNQGMSTKGLGLPRVELKDIKTKTDLAETMGLTSGTLDPDDHVGLIVYNIGKNETSANTRFCPGIHLWDGTEWQALTDYPKMGEQRVLSSRVLYNFTHLNPNNPADPMWATLGENASNYPLGYIGTFTDNRPNDTPQNYHYSRFYVGYVDSDDIYEITRDLSCAQDGSKISAPSTETILGNQTLEDGVWMAENLRAITMPNGAAITQSIAHVTGIPYINYPDLQASNRTTLGVLYNWAAAINMGTGVGQIPDPGNVDQSGLKEGSRIQGVCPNGWHLPSDRQWTDLENGIILYTSTFSSTATIGVTLSHTDAFGYRGSRHGEAIKSTTPVNGIPTNGTSKTASTGGFDARLAGVVAFGVVNTYGNGSNFWTASALGTGMAINRSVNSGSVLQGISRSQSMQQAYYSVRCKKD